MSRNETLPETAPRRWVGLLLGLLLAAAVWFVYRKAVGSGFLNWDDPDTVTGNPWVAGGGLSGLYHILTGRVFSTWLPVYFGSLWFDHLLFGLSASGYHLTNLAIHVANALLTGAIVYRLTGRRPLARAAAFLFALHPAAVQSVAWISERKGLLAYAFAALAILAFLSAIREDGGRRLRRHLAGAGLLAAALLAKGSALAVPLILVLYVVALADSRGKRRYLLDLAPYLAVAVALAVVHYEIAVDEGTAMAGSGPALGTLLLTDLTVLAGYLRLLVLPFWGQSAVHAIPLATGLTAGVLVGAGAVVALGVALVFAWRRDRLVFFALAAAVVALAPFNNVFPRTTVLFAERYLYFSLFGVALLLPLVAARLLRRAPGWAAPAALAGLALLLGGFAAARAATWRDPVTLFADAERKSDGSWLASMKLGEAWAARARNRDSGAWQHAADAFARALAAAETPLDAARAGANLSGMLLAIPGREDEVLSVTAAVERRLPELAPEEAAALTFNVEVNRGSALTAKKDYEGAAKAYRAAIRARPDEAAPYSALAGVLLAAGKADPALEAAREAVRIAPGDESAAVTLAQIDLATGDAGAARTALNRLLETAPRSRDALCLMGSLELAANRPKAARSRFSAALAISPDWPRAVKGRAEADLVLARSAWSGGKRADARSLAAQAMQEDPDNGRAVLFAGAISPDPEEADRLLLRASGLPGGQRAADMLATHRLRTALSRLDQKDEVAAAAGVARALKAGARRLTISGHLRLHGELPRLRALADAKDDAARRDALIGLALALADRGEEAEARLSAALVSAEKAGEFAGDATWTALYVRGRLRLREERPAEARDDFSILLDTFPKDAWAALGKADALFHVAAARIAKDGGDPEKVYAPAKEAALDATRLGPDLLPPRLTLGQIEFAMGNTVDSLRLFREAQRRFPEAVEPMLDLADLYRVHYQMTGDKTYLSAAESELTKAVDLAPHDARVRLAHGRILLMGGDAARAASELSIAVTEDPTLTAAKEALGDLFVRAGRAQLDRGGKDGREKAKEMAQRAIALDARQAGAHLLLAEIARMDRDYAPAERELSEARQYDPDSDEVRDAAAGLYKDIGYARFLRGDRKKALEAFRKAVAAGSKHVDLEQVKVLLAGAKKAPAGEPVDAKMRAVLEKKAAEAKAAFEEAGVKLEAGDLESAASAAQRSVAAFSTGEGWYRLGRIREEQKRDEEAMRAYENAVSEKPALSQAWMALGGLHYRRGEWSGAISAWKTFLDVAGDDVPEATKGKIRELVKVVRQTRDEEDGKGKPGKGSGPEDGDAGEGAKKE